MATTVMENALGAADFSSLSSVQDRNTSEASQYNMEDKACNGSFSVYRSSTGNEISGNPGCNYDYSSFNTQSRDGTNKSVEQAKIYLEEHSLSLKSNYSSYDLEKILNDSVVQQRLKHEPDSQSSIDTLLGGNFDSYKSNALASENPAENKWDFKTDYTSLACEKNITNSGYDKSVYDKSNYDKSIYDKNKQKNDKFPSADLNSGDFKSKSQSFDFEQLMQTYNFDAPKEATNTSETQLDVSKRLQTRSSYDFEASDVAMRLRSSVQSNFLSSELWKGTPPKTEETKCHGSTAVRTIEDILKQHGISDNIPMKSSCTIDDASKKTTTSLNIGQTNLSQNNESSSGMTKGTGSETGQFSSLQDKDPGNVYAISSNKDMNSLFRTDPAANSSHPDPKNFSSQGINSFIVNTSQNNETTTKSQNNETTTKSQNTAESEPLRKYGSCVDYSSAGKYGGIHSGSTGFRMFDYGKSSSLSGDNTRPSMHFSSIDSKPFDGNADMSIFDAPQADGKSTFNASKASHIDIIRNMGSATDALEYSMSTERQRLRKLDTMISATPFNYSSMELPRSLRAQYMSPERTYSSGMPSDLPSRRIYSTSNMPSTSSHGARYPTRNNLSGNVGQRDSSTMLNKSISAPGSAPMQSVATHGSSVDGRAVYWPPYGSKREYNMQYNNAYNPQLLEKLVNQKNGISNQKKLPANKKKECSLKNKREECGKRNDHQLTYHQTPTGINFLNSTQMKKPTTAEKKRMPGKLETKKKTTDKDFNHSKNISDLYDGFDFVKDLNRMWQETVFGPSAKPTQNQKGKYMPYKPASQDKKEAKPAGNQGQRDIFGKDLWQPTIQRSDSSWTLSGSSGTNMKHNTYGRDYGLQSVQKVRSQCSVAAPSCSQTKGKGSNCTMVKTKTNMSSAVNTKQPPATPKSILKQPNSKTAGCVSSNASRPQSSLAASSRSCTQTAYQLPYHLIRGFSPVDPHKPSRPSTTTLVKKQEPSTNKRLVSRTSTLPKQGRRM